jgi:5'-deoxynucleotidase YfbR-like HD superfamily hydrolase
MNLNVREMLVGHPVRLRYVYRFSTSRVQHPETVAEHSYYVCLYCLLIGRWCNEQFGKHKKIDMGLLLSRAVVHDMEESVSGDFPRPFKHSNSELKDMLEEASEHAINTVVEGLLGPTPNPLPYASAHYDFHYYWKNSKDSSEEGLILEFADFLSVLSFMYEELGQGGNRSIANHVRDMEAYFLKFERKEFDFLLPLVEQAREVLREVFPRKGAAGGQA